MSSFSPCTSLRTAVVFALGACLAGGLSVQAASPGAIAGSLVGSVRDVGGIPQMGAIVELFNRSDKRIGKALTNAEGEFGFDLLLPDVYSLKINLAAFMPALKRNIAIEPGVRRVMSIQMASMLSSVELLYSIPDSGTLMSDEWKWVLKSSMSSRPVLRVLDASEMDQIAARATGTHIFSDTSGVVRLSSGETSSSGDSRQSDLGTSFALATSVFGSNQVKVSGQFGYGRESELPSAAFQTSFSRANASGPEVKVMMQQVGLPTRNAGLTGGRIGNAPALRTLSLTMIESLQIADGFVIDYGASLDSVTFLDRLNYVSPFARVSYALGSGSLVLGYSSGAPPIELLNRRGEASSSSAMQDDLMALTTLPRVSIRGGGVNVERTQNLEASYTLELGKRSVTFGYFREAVSNAALALAAPSGFYMDDLLPDLSSNSSVFNIGNYRRTGYSAAVTQIFADNYSATVGFGRGGVLSAEDGVLATEAPEELRSKIRREKRTWLRGRLAGRTPVTHTRFVASYEWTDYKSLTPGHVYITQRVNPETGLNLRLRQPLPRFGGFPGRLEASIDFRNMLAQGYLPITLSDGRRLLLAHTPRTFRGGLSFIF